MSLVTRHARLFILGTLICVSTSACHHMRFPEPITTEAEPSQAAPQEEPTGDWSQLAAQGRSALRARDLAESEKAYRASLAATDKLEPRDVRVATALDNLARLATYYQQIDEPEKAASLVEVLAKNAEEGRKGDFETASVPMLAEAGRLAGEEDYDSAIRLYQLSLTLRGADKRTNRSAQMSARWNLMQTYIESGRIAEAEEQLEAVKREIDARYAADSRQALGLLIPTAQIQVANGDIAGAEENYQKVIDSDLTSPQQKASALELYIEALEGLDRKKEATALKARLKALNENP